MSGGKGLIAFTVPGRPIPCPRPRVTRKKTYLPAKYKAWRDEVKVLARQAFLGKEPWEGPVGLVVCFYGAHGSSDIDNLLKGVMDALEGIIYLNDRQVKRVRMQCVPSKEPETWIEIAKFDD